MRKLFLTILLAALTLGVAAQGNKYKKYTENLPFQMAEVKAPVIPDTPTPAKQMDKALFERLRDVRKALAQASHIAPYMVFSDKSLHAMATEKPTTQAEFGIIYGVGEMKCQKYWRPFTAAIRDYLEERQ